MQFTSMLVGSWFYEESLVLVLLKNKNGSNGSKKMEPLV